MAERPPKIIRSESPTPAADYKQENIENNGRKVGSEKDVVYDLGTHKGIDVDPTLVTLSDSLQEKSNEDMRLGYAAYTKAYSKKAEAYGLESDPGIVELEGAVKAERKKSARIAQNLHQDTISDAPDQPKRYTRGYWQEVQNKKKIETGNESKKTESLQEMLARIQAEKDADKTNKKETAQDFSGAETLPPDDGIIDAEFEDVPTQATSYEGAPNYPVPALREPDVTHLHPEAVDSEEKKRKADEERLDEIKRNLGLGAEFSWEDVSPTERPMFSREDFKKHAESMEGVVESLEKAKKDEEIRAEKLKNNKETIKNNPEAGAKDKKKEKRAKRAAFVRTAGKETLRGAVGVGLLAGAAVAFPSVGTAMVEGPVFGPVNEALLASLHLSSMPLVGFLLADSFLSYIGIRLIAGLPELWNDIVDGINKRGKGKLKIPQFKVKNKKYT